VGAVSYHGEMGEGARRNTRMEPGSRKRRPLWTASSRKTDPKWVCKGLDELSTIFQGSTNNNSMHRWRTTKDEKGFGLGDPCRRIGEKECILHAARIR
jgi:hypothetical protein